MALMNESKNKMIAKKVLVANNFIARSKGLLGKSSFEKDQTLWIKRCNSVHTFFMKFNMDCVFVDKNLVVKAIHKDIPPWRITFPAFTANSVFEMSAGQLNDLNISIGDQLNVGS